MEGPSEFNFRCHAEDAGERIDKVICRHLPSLGRASVARLCEEGKVTANGRRVKKNHLAQEGAHIIVQPGYFGVAQPAPEVALSVVAESSDWVIVEKPAGIATAAIKGRELGTLAGALLSNYPEMAGIGYGPSDPGLIHRLDTYTSGLVVAARNAHAFSVLKKALSEGRLLKRYLALVPHGALVESGVCELPLSPHPKNKRRVHVDPAGHPCQTAFKVLQRHQHMDLVEVTVHTAYRHQIRAHLAALSAPLVGDAIYGSQFSNFAPRHALHASHISCAAPDVTPFSISSDLPTDLRDRLAL